ncbi:hypothetical protein BJD55_gp111 [Gordonia phage Yvonnetastic]|uniref:Uncharacterized protein n=1 Tax=Gordonia phage Yvonnetastic TaxID=1821566 RepID=A0A142K972_9CAUD|nr:hypothetical protein BJD55_gp111 [Gordonia phage Yvonnetastic]AMS02655.1 hypothetical protein SEA_YVONNETASTIC_111 [Gordonia phage Yvonnetastic]
MITVPIYVNSRTIGQLYITRITNVDEVGDDDQVSTYQVELWTAEEKATFNLDHRYGDGAWLLISKALAEYHKIRGES